MTFLKALKVYSGYSTILPTAAQDVTGVPPTDLPVEIPKSKAAQGKN